MLQLFHESVNLFGLFELISCFQIQILLCQIYFILIRMKYNMHVQFCTSNVCRQFSIYLLRFETQDQLEINMIREAFCEQFSYGDANLFT